MTNIVYLSNPDKPNYINTPESLAYQIILLNKNIDIRPFYGDAFNYSQVDFGLRFAKECAICVVQGYKNNPTTENLEILVNRLAENLYQLGGIEFATGISMLNNTLIEQCPQLYSQEQHGLKIDITFLIVTTLNKTFNYDRNRQSIIGNMFGMHII